MHLLGSKGGRGSGCSGTLSVHCWAGGGGDLARGKTEVVCLGSGSIFGMRYLRLPFLLIMLSTFSGGQAREGLAGAGARLRCFFTGRMD